MKGRNLNLKQFLKHMEKYRLFALLSPILMTLEVFTDIAVPYLMSRIVDVGIVNQDISYVIRFGIYMIVTAIIGMLFGIFSAYAGAKAGYGFAAEIRHETFQKVQNFSFSNLDQFKVSSLITRLTNDCNTIGQVTMMSLRMGIRAPLMMTLALVMSFRINSSLATIFAVALPLTAGFILFILAKARPLFFEIQERVDDVNAIIRENLAGIGVVKSFNREKYEEARFKKRNDALMDTAMKAISIIILLMPFIHIITYSTIIAALWFGGKQIVAGSMGRGELMSFITYITQVLISLMMISMFFMQLLRGIASKDRILAIWNTKSELKEKNNSVHEVQDGSISFNDVCFRYYEDGDVVLNDINLQIKSGETVGIIGSTGSSKSTLVQLIPRLYDVTRGSVEVGGIDVRDYDLKSLRDQVAFVLQHNTLFSGTIRSNMLWGNEGASDEQIIEALQKAQAWEFVSKLTDKLDSKVEQGGDNFSGGQKQRLTIVRALMKDPKIIILDDSTSAVDMTTDAKIQLAFSKNLDHITTLIIGQRISSIKHADRIVVMEWGKIEAVGTHRELLTSSPIYQEIYDSQQKGVVSA